MSTSAWIAATAVLGLAALVLAALWLRARRTARAARREARIRSREAGELHDHVETLQRRVEQIGTRLAESDEARESFFDLTTHELRSPLSAILGYQELLQDGAYGDLGDGADDAIVRIGRSARHLLHLIDGVVELSRIRAGTVSPDAGPVDLGVLLTAVADAFRNSARDRRLEPTVDIPQTLPTIRSDQERLVRALDLFVTSAVKHPAETQIRLEVTASHHTIAVRIGETDIDVRHDADDLSLRVGIRLAVAQGIADILGGSLEMDEDDAGVVRSLTFRIRPLPDPAERSL